MLMEFIATSAAYHDVKKQPLHTLEEDLLKVFSNNVMPANAAAWYMEQRKAFMDQPYDRQLLPILMSNYPEKFRILGSQVMFLEVYEQETARQKLQYLMQQGLFSYFSQKAGESAVYFFNPFYYELTQPFYEALRQVSPRSGQGKLVRRYFDSLKDTFLFTQHSSSLSSITKLDSVEIVTNVPGCVFRMVNSQCGLIKFRDGEKAVFNIKSLFKDGSKFTGNPLELPGVCFDGYQVEGTWYAASVWCGQRPDSTKHYSSFKDLDNGVLEGEVVEIHEDGAVIDIGDDLVWIPGWRRQQTNCPRLSLSTLEGDLIGLGDLVSCLTSCESKEGFTAVGRNATVVKKCKGLNDSTYDSEGDRSEEELSEEPNEEDLAESCSESEASISDESSSSEEDLYDCEIDTVKKELGTILVDDSTKTVDGYTPLSGKGESFWYLEELLANISEYNSDSDPDYSEGDYLEDSEESMSDDSDWAVSCSRPEVFDPETGLWIPVDRNYREEEDPDFELPVIDSDSDVDETETKDCEVQLLNEEATVEVNDKCEHNLSTECSADVHLVSYKTSLVNVEAGCSPSLWIQELKHTEQPEQYDSDEDEEYFPTEVGLDSDCDYDEYESGDDVIPTEEVSSLLEESLSTIKPPPGYFAVWVDVGSVKSRNNEGYKRLMSFVGDSDSESEISEGELEWLEKDYAHFNESSLSSYNPLSDQGDSFTYLNQLLDDVSQDYHSDSDSDYSIGDNLEDPDSCSDTDSEIDDGELELLEKDLESTENLSEYKTTSLKGKSFVKIQQLLLYVEEDYHSDSDEEYRLGDSLNEVSFGSSDSSSCSEYSLSEFSSGSDSCSDTSSESSSDESDFDCCTEVVEGELGPIDEPDISPDYAAKYIKASSFIWLQQMLLCVEEEYHSDSDADYSLGDELEDLDHPMSDNLSNSETGSESSDTSDEEPDIASDLELPEDELAVLEKDVGCKYEYIPEAEKGISFMKLQQLLLCVDCGYNSEEDHDYSIGDELEEIEYPQSCSDYSDSENDSSDEDSDSDLEVSGDEVEWLLDEKNPEVGSDYEQESDKAESFIWMQKLISNVDTEEYRSESDEDYSLGDELEKVDYSDSESSSDEEYYSDDEYDSDRDSWDSDSSDSCSDSDLEVDVPEGELGWLEKDRETQGSNEEEKFKTGYVPVFEKGESFIYMQHLLSTVDKDYDSYSDDSYSIGDEMEDLDDSEEDSEDEMPDWVKACSLPEKFDATLEKFVPVDSDYDEECDSDYELPVSDDDTDAEIEEQDEEIQLLAKESEQDVKEQISSIEASETVPKSETICAQDPSMWEEELLNKEQDEDYDSDEDEEYVPPVDLDSSFDYDEYESGDDLIPEKEVSYLLEECLAPVDPPSGYLAVWVDIGSVEERISKAKAEEC